MRMITILIYLRNSIEKHSHSIPALPDMKHFARTIHLWTGLIFGTLLVLQGLTGAVLSWRTEIDAWLNPALMHVVPPGGVRDGGFVPVARATPKAVLERLSGEP